jgi:hypothetical protein
MVSRLDDWSIVTQVKRRIELVVLLEDMSRFAYTLAVM